MQLELELTGDAAAPTAPVANPYPTIAPEVVARHTALGEAAFLDPNLLRRSMSDIAWDAYDRVRADALRDGLETGKVVDAMFIERRNLPRPRTPADVVPFERRVAAPAGSVDGPGGFAA